VWEGTIGSDSSSALFTADFSACMVFGDFWGSMFLPAEANPRKMPCGPQPAALREGRAEAAAKLPGGISALEKRLTRMAARL